MGNQNKHQKDLKIIFLILGFLIVLISTSPLLNVPSKYPSLIHIDNANLNIKLESAYINSTNMYNSKELLQRLERPLPSDTIKVVLWIKNMGADDFYSMDAGNFGYVNAVLSSQGEDSVVLKSGKLIEIKERDVWSYKAILPLHLKSNQAYKLALTCTHYLPQFQPRNFTLKFELTEQWVNANYFRYASQSLFIGCIIVMALYNLLLFFAVRDVSYLFYVVSIIGVGLYFSFYYGFTLELLWQSYPKWDAYSFGIILPLTGVARVLFTKSYLKPVIYKTFWDTTLNTLAVLYIIPLLLTIWSLFYGETFAAIIVYTIGILSNIVLLTMLISSFYAHFKGYKPAKYFILANLFFIVGSILFILREIEILPNTLITTYSAQVGILMQVILFSLGLADRLNIMRLQLTEDQLKIEKTARKEEVNRKHKLNKQKEELENLVTIRTYDLNLKKVELEQTVLQLKTSQKALKSTNKVKDKMFTLIAHDLKAPLATFDSFLNILVNHIDDMSNAKRKKLIVSTKSSLQSMNILLDNLLKWSRSQLSPAIANKEIVNINEIIVRTLRLFNFALETKNIKLNQTLECTKLVYADKNMIATVVRNLVNNAIKFTPKGQIIELSTRCDDTFFYFKIFNSNTDISNEIIRQISKFDGVFKTKGTDNEEGYGLGLMLCNEFVQKNNGVLQAEIIKGKGIAFTVNFLILSPTDSKTQE